MASKKLKLKDIKGLKEKEAIKKITGAGMEALVVCRDGKVIAVPEEPKTSDKKLIQLIIEKAKVKYANIN